MTRGQLNRMMVIPALMVTAGIAIALIYLLPLETDPDGSICDLSDSAAAPSGRTLALCQTLSEQQPSGEVWTVIRVVDRDVAAASTNHADHDWICATWGLPTLQTDPRPARIIVQIMAQPFVRGEPAQGTTQSIEAYSTANGTCEWELL